MTTIVYHGREKTFAMDSMVTWTSGSKQHRVENSYKIEDLTQANIVSHKGERLIAICYAGNTGAFERAQNFVLNNLHNWKEKFEEIKEAGGQMLGSGTVRLILVTDKFTYVFYIAGHVTVEVKEPTEFVSAGSGGWMADAAHFVYGADAMDAVKAAALVDEGSGYLIHSLTIRDGQLVPNEPFYITDPQAEVMAMRKRAGKATCFDSAKHTATFANRYRDLDERRDKKLQKVREDQQTLIRQKDEAETQDKAKAQKQVTGKVAKKKARKKPQKPAEAVPPIKPILTRAKSGPLPARA